MKPTDRAARVVEEATRVNHILNQFGIGGVARYLKKSEAGARLVLSDTRQLDRLLKLLSQDFDIKGEAP